VGGNSATDDEWGEDSIESDTDYNSGDGMGSNTGASSGGQLGDYDDTRFATGRWLGPFHELVHQHPHSGPPPLLPARRRRMQSLAQEAEGARFDLRRRRQRRPLRPLPAAGTGSASVGEVPPRPSPARHGRPKGPLQGPLPRTQRPRRRRCRRQGATRRMSPRA
jgi:hypothetical protein